MIQKTSENGIVKPAGFDTVQGSFNVNEDEVTVTAHLPITIRLNRKDGTFTDGSDLSPFNPALIEALKADAEAVNAQF